jgi:hypothetical protein
MNKAERIKVANAEWHRLNEIDTEIECLFNKLMREMETLDHYERKYSGYWIENANKYPSNTKAFWRNGKCIEYVDERYDWYDLKLIRCNDLIKKIAMLIESKGD